MPQMPEPSEFAFALGLTLFAGLATGIGGLAAFVRGGIGPRFIAGALGFSAGAMLYVSFVEILAEARHVMSEELGAGVGGWVALASFFGGMVIVGAIDRCVPEPTIGPARGTNSKALVRARLLRTGAFTAGAIVIHNVPEGFATFIVALQEPTLAIPVALAIAVHNIPEGIAVAIPFLAATGSRLRAFTIALGSGLAEPVGALVGFAILAPVLSDTVLGVTLGAIAGIMVYVCVDELMPAAHMYDVRHVPVYSMVAGMLVMGASLELL